MDEAAPPDVAAQRSQVDEAAQRSQVDEAAQRSQVDEAAPPDVAAQRSQVDEAAQRSQVDEAAPPDVAAQSQTPAPVRRAFPETRDVSTGGKEEPTGHRCIWTVHQGLLLITAKEEVPDSPGPWDLPRDISNGFKKEQTDQQLLPQIKDEANVGSLNPPSSITVELRDEPEEYHNIYPPREGSTEVKAEVAPEPQQNVLRINNEVTVTLDPDPDPDPPEDRPAEPEEGLKEKPTECAALSKRKTRFSTEEALEEIARFNEEELQISEDDSETSSFDLAAEDLFSDGLDPVLHRPSSDPSDNEISEEDWEPEASLPRKKRFRSSVDPDTTSPAEDPSASTAATGGRTARKWGRRRGSRRAASTSASKERWQDIDVADVQPPQPSFKPARKPGPQLSSTSSYSALKLFQLFFSTSVLKTIVRNTNAYGAKSQEGSDESWQDISIQDMYSYLALVIYMDLTKFTALIDYWRTSQLYGLQLPTSIMSCKKFQFISSALRMSDPKVDAKNDKKRGTPAFDHLCKIKPLYQQIRDACKRHFHPSQNIAVDERTVASKAQEDLKQCMKNKSTNREYKLFVLADSCSAYTWNFCVYRGESLVEQSKGLGYESVMALVDEKALGTGYRLFVDHFNTSPTLFKDLLKKKVWACGAVRPNRVGFPKTTVNDLARNAPRGSLRWIRDGELLFLKWKDTQEVLLCSTIHRAYGGDTVRRRLKGDDGQWTSVEIPFPAAVKEYKRKRRRVDQSVVPNGYYSVILKTKKWYKALFYRFVDLAVTNAYILQRELAKAKNEKPLSKKAFRETLVLELTETGCPSTARSAPATPPSHTAKYISGDSTAGRRKCKLCHQKTPLICMSCDAPLCFLPKRDCFNDWHDQKNL